MRMRRRELVATRLLSELNKNTTVALEQKLPPLHTHQPRIAAWAASHMCCRNHYKVASLMRQNEKQHPLTCLLLSELCWSALTLTLTLTQKVV